jgi:hypothetical protein
MNHFSFLIIENIFEKIKTRDDANENEYAPDWDIKDTKAFVYVDTISTSLPGAPCAIYVCLSTSLSPREANATRVLGSWERNH